MIQNVTEWRCLIHRMQQNVTEWRCLIHGMQQNVTEWRCLIHGMQQNVTKFSCLIHEMLKNLYRSKNNGMLQNNLQIELRHLHFVIFIYIPIIRYLLDRNIPPHSSF